MKTKVLALLLTLGLLRLTAGPADTNSSVAASVSSNLYAGTYSVAWSTNLVRWYSNGVTYIPGGYSEFVFRDGAQRWWQIKPLKN